MKTLFKNATVVNADGSRQADVLVCDDKIKLIQDRIESPDAKLVDCAGLLLFPGAIDAHTHFDLDVAGTTTADDFAVRAENAYCPPTNQVRDVVLAAVDDLLRNL